MTIPRIGVNAPLARVGLGAGGAIAGPPPEEPGLAGWFAGGPTPGRPGAAVLVGDLVFARLADLRAGDLVGVVRADDTVAVFRVVGSAAPPEGGYRAPSRPGGAAPELRLVSGDLVVYAAFTAAYGVADLTGAL
ncbi:sortase domain-containing protein [Actinomadura parmotrematis]|uniref:Uncharacterized protein n=1 Tax=Actinomadura parmotrematis TaxID=2864039 RepID=A0ABS7G758_9ACTN|nr:class F sortase [Actinomadura parmotrematis]MBW8487463.1 hypothetical protein [Actinomadura parmotrematis]